MTRKKPPRWIPKSAVLAIHEQLIAEHGGMPRLRSEALLDSALASPKDLLAHGTPDLFEMAARYAASLTRNHPFHDGNKRIAFTVALVFLELNGWSLDAPEADAVSMVLALSTKQLEDTEFAAWLRENAIRRRKARRATPPRVERRPRKKR